MHEKKHRHEEEMEHEHSKKTHKKRNSHLPVAIKAKIASHKHSSKKGK